MNDPAAGEPPSRRLGDFEILREIGRGGMGIVYEARQLSLNRQVALKVLSGALGLSSKAVARFHLEAEAAAKLHHTNIVPIYATGEVGGTHYYAMELIDGPSLDRVIREQRGGEPRPAPVPDLTATAPFVDGATPSTPASSHTSSTLGSGPGYFDTVARRLAEVADALDYAHKQAVIHRDIKPSNLLLSPDGRLSINDFGLARMLEQPGVTLTGEFVGTPAYMSPEQIAAGRAPLDHRTDIYSLGATLYELLTLRPPFIAQHRDQIIALIMHKEPPPPRRLNRKVPVDLETICLKAMEKDPDRRYQTAGAMADDLRRFVNRFAIAARRASPLVKLAKFAGRHKLGVTAAAVMALLTVAAAFGAYKYWGAQTELSAEQQRTEDEQWVREQAIPGIRRLIGEKNYRAAFDLALEAERRIPDDPTLAELRPEFSSTWSVLSDPPQADVFWKPYGVKDAQWTRLGRTPLEGVTLPRGSVVWKLTKEGYAAVEGGRTPQEGVARFVLDKSEAVPPGMVRVAGNQYRPNPYGVGKLKAVDLPDYFMDRYEVTNRQFKAFVDAGGYQKKAYWKHPLVKDETELSWEAALKEFRDETGAPGPAGWRSGTYPRGEDDHPVRGVSWHEAAAYAEFAGKSLPTIIHWLRASGADYPEELVQASNFSRKGPAAVGSYPGVGPFGTYDTAGNVKEWCLNKMGGDRRCLMGGGWDDATYVFTDWDGQSAFDRSPAYGFRCVKYLSDSIPEAALAEAILEHRDYRAETPVPDEQFRFIRGLYTYDKAPLNAKVLSRTEHPDCIHEVIQFDAAYANEKVLGHLFLPRNARPPFQTIVFFPGANAFMEKTFPRAEPPGMVAFLVRSGRAVFWPLYKESYERRSAGRRLQLPLHDTRGWSYTRELYFHVAKDFFRSIDYLEQREELDMQKLGYFGHSMGGWMGVMLLAVDERPKVAVFSAGGLHINKIPFPEVDPINFVSRVKTPTIMINGRNDTNFYLEINQRPMFKLLATAEADKSHRVFDGLGHGMPLNILAQEALPWLDKYLGPVARPP